jgi:hypothetical protein
LRRQRRSGLRTAADCNLHHRIMSQAVEVDRILVPARDRRRTGHKHLEHLMQDAGRITAIRHRRRKPLAHTNLAFRRPKKQQAAIGGLGAAVEIYCEFLTANGWQIEGERRIVGHGGCGGALIAQGKAIGHRFAM